MRGSFLCLMSAAACASSRPAQTLLAQQQREIRKAEAAGAADLPEAAFYLRAARAELVEAERQFLQGQPERAQSLLGAVQADAQLAAAIATADSTPDLLENTSYPARSLFEPNSAILSATGQALLSRLAEQLRREPSPNIELRAYTDAAGSKAVNQALATEQAEQVRDYLVQHGVPGGRVRARGMGADGDEPAPARRRIDVRVQRAL